MGSKESTDFFKRHNRHLFILGKMRKLSRRAESKQTENLCCRGVSFITPILIMPCFMLEIGGKPFYHLLLKYL